MSKMQEYFQGLVRAGIIPQEPMNYDAASMKIYITYLEEENATLKEMLKKLAVTINEIYELLKEYSVEVEE